MSLRWLLPCAVLLACAHSGLSQAEAPPPPAPQAPTPQSPVPKSKVMTAPFGTQYVARGNCIIVEPRKKADVEWVDDACDKDVKGDIGTGYTWFVDRLRVAFEAAEQLTCGKPGCAAKDRAVRFYITWGQVPWLSSVTDEERIEIRMSTALIDLVESYARTYLAEAKANGKGDGARFTRWLEDIAAKSGKPCVPMERPSRDLQLSPQDVDLLMKLSQPFYVFTMLHELAHFQEGPDCGAGLDADDLTQEIACDEKAFDAMGNIPNARFPVQLLMPMVALSHHQALMDPLLAREQGLPEGRLFSDDFVASQWHLRADILTNRWETHCFEGKSADDLTCKWWRELVDHVRGYLLKPLPGICGSQPRQVRAAVVSDPEAAACLRSRDDLREVAWVRDGDPPIVKVTAGYQNTCRRPVRCEVRVETGTKPVKKEGVPPWLPVSAVMQQFELAPGRFHRVDTTVRWTRTADRFPSVRYPHPGSRDMDLATCEFTGPPVEESADASWSEAWCKPLQDLADAAGKRFTPLTEGEPDVIQRSNLKVFKTRLRLPGAEECDITQGKDSAWVSCNYGDFQSETAVTREYERAIAAAKACLEGASAEEEADDDATHHRRTTSLTKKGTPLEVKVERSSADGDVRYHSLSVDVWRREAE